MKTINSEWADYRKNVMHVSSPPIQVMECKRAFFAGNMAMYRMFMEMGERIGATEEEEREVFEAIEKEFEDFLNQQADAPKGVG